MRVCVRPLLWHSVNANTNLLFMIKINISMNVTLLKSKLTQSATK